MFEFSSLRTTNRKNHSIWNILSSTFKFYLDFEIKILSFILVLRNSNKVSILILINLFKSNVLNINSLYWFLLNNNDFSVMTVYITILKVWENELSLEIRIIVISLNNLIVASLITIKTCWYRGLTRINSYLSRICFEYISFSRNWSILCTSSFKKLTFSRILTIRSPKLDFLAFITPSKAFVITSFGFIRWISVW